MVFKKVLLHWYGATLNLSTHCYCCIQLFDYISLLFRNNFCDSHSYRTSATPYGSYPNTSQTKTPHKGVLLFGAAYATKSEPFYEPGYRCPTLLDKQAGSHCRAKNSSFTKILSLTMVLLTTKRINYTNSVLTLTML